MSEELILPDDLKSCQELVVQLAATVKELQDQNLEQKLKIVCLLKLAFARRSERYIESPDQLKLDLGESDLALDAIEGLKDARAEQEQEQTVSAHVRKRPRRQRQEGLPEHLPRYEIAAEASPEQLHCAEHGERQVIGYDRVETLEFTRPQLKVRVTLYPK